MFWFILKCIVLLSVPVIPINPTINRPDPAKYVWTFECDGFQSNYTFLVQNKSKIYSLCSESKLFYSTTIAAKHLRED